MSDPIRSQLTVVGAGPAGIMAAFTAAEAGVEVTLIDDNPMPGGQYYRQSPPEFKFSNPLDAQSGRLDAPQILNKLPHPKIRTIYNTQVWGVFDDRTLALADRQQSSLLQAERIILATGAYDRPMAFPGWTLPGVLGSRCNAAHDQNTMGVARQTGFAGRVGSAAACSGGRAA